MQYRISTLARRAAKMYAKSAKRLRTSVLITNAINYCETTTLHGFVYWVQARNHIEKLIWILITLTCFICSCYIVSLSIRQWIAEPGITSIQSFSKVGNI